MQDGPENTQVEMKFGIWWYSEKHPCEMYMDLDYLITQEVWNPSVNIEWPCFLGVFINLNSALM